MRVAQSVVALGLLGACRHDRGPVTTASSVPATSQSPAQQLIGCYMFRSDSLPTYRLRLDVGGKAQLVGPGAPWNQREDEWSWRSSGTAGDSSFTIHWSGIDGFMDFAVSRREGRWTVKTDAMTGQPNVRWEPKTTVEPVECPPPGA